MTDKASSPSSPQLNTQLYEPFEVRIYQSTEQLGRYAAEQLLDIAHTAAQQAVGHNPAVIVLPTGSTPIPMYREIIKLAEKGEVNFSNTIFFNLDEYVGLSKTHPQSFHYFMQKHFYELLEQLLPEARLPLATHLPRAVILKEQQAEQEAQRYENLFNNVLQSFGKTTVDLVILGVGGAYPEEKKLKGGHIGYNEPGTVELDPFSDRTKIVQLSKKTIKDNNYKFSNLTHNLATASLAQSHEAIMPNMGITLGVGNILQSQRILLLATGEEKAPVIERFLDAREVDPDFPVTYLKNHSHVTVVMDQEAATRSSYYSSPWEKDATIFEDVQEQRKLLLTILRNSSTHEHAKIVFNGRMEHIGHEVRFERVLAEFQSALKSRLHSPEQRLLPNQGERVLVISPHPDDDVICATVFMRETQGETLVCYTTNGELAVRAEDAEWARERSLSEFSNVCIRNDISHDAQLRVITRQVEALQALELIREEAAGAILPPHFLNADCYYRRGIPGVEAVTQRDIQEMYKLLNSFRPSHILFSAENDSHGTHGQSTDIVRQALQNLRAHSENDWIENIVLLGYRGAYAEHELFRNPEELLIVPFSYEEAERKRSAILAHSSQAGEPLFPSFDSREFWQRAAERNRETVRHLEHLEIIPPKQFEGAEVFRRVSLIDFLKGSSRSNIDSEPRIFLQQH